MQGGTHAREAPRTTVPFVASLTLHAGLLAAMLLAFAGPQRGTPTAPEGMGLVWLPPGIEAASTLDTTPGIANVPSPEVPTATESAPIIPAPAIPGLGILGPPLVPVPAFAERLPAIMPPASVPPIPPAPPIALSADLAIAPTPDAAQPLLNLSLAEAPLPTPQYEAPNAMPTPAPSALANAPTTAARPPQPTVAAERASRPRQARVADASQRRNGEAQGAASEVTQTASAAPAIALAGPVLITAPRFRSPPMPAVYPPRAIEFGLTGTVLVRALVAPDGRTQEMRVWRSSGQPLLDAAAVAAVRRWAFEPASVGGRHVEAWVEVPVNFQLN